MDFIPKYPQPFTFERAMEMDISLINDEIARLQNSLQHLRATQETLRSYINSSQGLPPDPEFTNALKENELVIGSQEERITLLTMVLYRKGVLSAKAAHYDVLTQVDHPSQLGTSNSDLPPFVPSNDVNSGGDAGIDL